jgi:mannose-6-phosphate isomerase-like protein (cupin superfamily)
VRETGYFASWEIGPDSASIPVTALGRASREIDVDGKPVKVKAGDVLFVPAGTVHAAKNVSGNGAELATYVVEKGKPLITLVK